MSISSIRGKADLDYHREIVARAKDNLHISDNSVGELTEFTKLNFLRGGYDACGELNEKDRRDDSHTGRMDREDTDWLRNEDIYN